MAKKVETLSYQMIIEQIENRQFLPVYLLMGEEAYYIDKIADAIDNTVLTEDEKSFNQTVIYCTREMDEISYFTNALRKYPMMSEYQVVFLKEAQNLKILDQLLDYVQNPLRSTILVICYKHGTVNRRTKLVAAIEKAGLVYESPKLKDGSLPKFIDDYLSERKLKIEASARSILADSIGSDLNRLTGELDKLIVTMPKGENTVTPELIERHIGISKDFNVWELQRALINKDIFKANQIITYFNSNPKANPPIATVAILFRFFSVLMLAYYAPGTSESALMDYLDIHSSWVLRDYLTAKSRYSGRKVMDIIGKLREADARLKGVGVTGDIPASDIMQELIYFILH